jgi:predicted nucleic acid-binding protein
VIAYFDSSAFVKLFKLEDDSEEALGLWMEADAVVTSQLTYPETRAALRRWVGPNQVVPARHRTALRRLDEAWSQLVALDVDAEIRIATGDLIDRHRLSGADAVQLSTALIASGEDLLFVTWDRRLADGALAEGIPVAPA